MATVVPTVLATTPDEYADRLERAAAVSPRIHLDFTDGKLTPNPTINLAQAYPPTQPRDIDIHLMAYRPMELMQAALSLQPSLVIIHAEAYDGLMTIVERLHAYGVAAGLALLPETSVESVDDDLIQAVDHVLLFTGTLGVNGGEFHADQLKKVPALRQLKANLEISVDGGVVLEQAKQAVAAGIDVLDVGNAIQAAADPQAAYRELSEMTA